MAKKLVVRRDLHKRRRGGAPYLKYLVLAALALIFLVVVTPHLLKNKRRETAEKRPLPNSGAVTKKLPKPARELPIPGEPQGSAAVTTAPGAVKSTIPVASTTPEPPGSVKPPQTQVAPKPAQKAPATSKQASLAETKSGLPSAATAKPSTPAPAPQAARKPLFPALPKVSTPAQPAETPHTVPKVLFPKKASRPNGPAAEPHRARAAKAAPAASRRTKTVASAKPAHNQGIRHGAGHAFHPSLSESYAVQVGSIFSTFGQAESLRKQLAAKGYRTSIRHVACLGFLVVTSPCSRSKAYTLLVQMNAEGLTQAKVVPVDSHAR